MSAAGKPAVLVNGRCRQSRNRSVSRPDVRQLGLRARSIGEEEDLRHRERVCVGDGEERSAGPHRLEAAQRTACQPQLRRSASSKHFDVLPEDAARVAGAERLHGRLFCGKSSGEVRRGVPPPHTIINLCVGEHARQEPVAIPLDDIAHARDVRGIEPQPDDAHDRSSAY